MTTKTIPASLVTIPYLRPIGSVRPIMPEDSGRILNTYGVAIRTIHGGTRFDIVKSGRTVSIMGRDIELPIVVKTVNTPATTYKLYKNKHAARLHGALVMSVARDRYFFSDLRDGLEELPGLILARLGFEKES